MKVAVLGAGFTGLACAVYLTDFGHDVEVFETEKKVGGLAVGYAVEKWRWPLEIFYHHIFTNDSDIIEVARKVGSQINVYEPVTSCFIGGKEIRLDSPVSVLNFKYLSIWSRLRMALGLGILKVIPNGIFLEKYKANRFLPKLIGEEAYKVIWKKLLKAKFGSKFDDVNMAWFWSRVAKRTKNLGYFEGGFQNLAEKMKEYAESRGAKFHMGTKMGDDKKFDKVIVTIPAPLVGKEVKMPKIDYLFGQTLILRLKQGFQKSYWLNILEKDWPFLVSVEHTNMVDKKNYGGETVLYLGNYLEENNPQLKKSKEESLEMYLPFLKKINSEFDIKWIIDFELFRKPYAQPVFPTNYSAELASVTKKSGKYVFGNMSMVYPFDRGTNYAVKMGKELALDE